MISFKKIGMMLSGVSITTDSGEDWRAMCDTTLPDLTDGSWTQTFYTDFTKIKDMDGLRAAKWAPSVHGLRCDEYWCPQMLEFSDKGLIIHSERRNNHECSVCKKEGIFTGGIDTRIKSGDSIEPLFQQAFGYFEATVIVPRGTGMWSAFWLQSDGVGKIGHKGMDGTEIDVYESSFIRENATKTGQALHYDAYKAPFYRCQGNVTDVGYNLYDGEPHTYAVRWSPTEYVMYVDGNAVWASNFGCVSRVPQFLRLTVEIRPNKTGPYAQQLGDFVNRSDGANDFLIKEVKVYQNKNYIDFIMKDSDFNDMKKKYIASACAAGGAILLAGATTAAMIYKKLIRKR